MPATLALLKDFFDGKERQRAVCWADCVIGPSATLDFAISRFWCARSR